jgi:hypothetical protein
MAPVSRLGRGYAFLGSSFADRLYEARLRRPGRRASTVAGRSDRAARLVHAPLWSAGKDDANTKGHPMRRSSVALTTENDNARRARLGLGPRLLSPRKYRAAERRRLSAPVPAPGGPIQPMEVLPQQRVDSSSVWRLVWRLSVKPRSPHERVAASSRPIFHRTCGGGRPRARRASSRSAGSGSGSDSSGEPEPARWHKTWHQRSERQLP